MEIKLRKAELETVIGVKSAVPENTVPEFAFAGKSNVGKSSLINTLTQRKALARTSATPGKTQTINYYSVNLTDGTNDCDLYLVDLPGYGYTKASEDSRASWGRMVERYLHKSGTLETVFLLVDIRHTPGENDRQMYEWIKANGYTPAVIATKLDKLKKNEIPKAIRAIREAFDMKDSEILIPFSSETKAGREEVLELLIKKEEQNG